VVITNAQFILLLFYKAQFSYFSLSPPMLIISCLTALSWGCIAEKSKASWIVCFGFYDLVHHKSDWVYTSLQSGVEVGALLVECMEGASLAFT
jgi:hypothetical protein